MRLIAILAISLLLLVSCGKDSPTAPDDKFDETPELKEFCQNIDKALKDSDISQLKSNISEETLNYYKAAIDANSDKLQGFAEIFATRKLISLDSVQAVYEIAYQGKYYQISFTKDDSGKWKLTDI